MSKRNKKNGPPQATAVPGKHTADPLRTFQQHLLVVAISPVQPFIGAARRMRDLAFGSQLLSGLAGAVGGCLQTEHAAQLIFPAIAVGAAAGCAGTARSTNKIVCLLPHKKQPVEVAAALRLFLSGKLDDLATECLQALGRDRAGVDEAAVREQMRYALQLFVGWSRVLSESGEAYAAAYHQAHVLLDARKGLRNLVPPPARPGRLLSSLDGARDSVLADGHLPMGTLAGGGDAASLAAVGRLRQRFQIDVGEQLDAISLAKRVLGTEQGFPALVRVALQPWVAQWQHDAAHQPRTPAGHRLQDLSNQLECLHTLGLGRRNRVPGGHPAAILPFDGDLLLRPRRRLALQQALHGSQQDVQALLQGLDKLLADEPALSSDDALSVALLAADGDHMGSQILSGAADTRPPGAMHRKIAEALAAFAAEAVRIVRQHGGCDLYAGGDDLLAALPVQTALACAEALRLAYTQRLRAVLDQNLRASATLSIGVAMGHVSQPMGRLLQQARDACQFAKDGFEGHGLRNALSLAVQPRAGALVRTVRRWHTDPADPQTDAVRWLQRWTNAFADGQVSGSLPYDLLRLAEDEPSFALVAATDRLFGRRGIERPDLQQDISAHWAHALADNRPVAIAARRLADALYLCRWLARHPKPAVPTDTQAPYDPENNTA